MNPTYLRLRLRSLEKKLSHTGDLLKKYPENTSLQARMARISKLYASFALEYYALQGTPGDW